MKTKWFVLLILPVFAVCCNRVGAGSVARTLTFQGKERTYVLHVPASLDKNSPAPLVLVLHGRLGSGSNVEGVTGFDAISDREGFIVAYPDGLGRRWNDGRVTKQTRYSDVDDVGFLSALVDALAAQYSVDPKRVYAAGESNGGFMCHRLACEAPSKFAAVAPVIASVSKFTQANCPTGPAMPIVMFNGTKDPLVPWNGGYVGHVRAQGEVLSVEQSVAFWVERDGCNPTPQETQEPDTDPKDGTRVYKTAYTGGRDGSEVVLYKIDGGGHTWPGGHGRQLRLFLGKVSQDINASEIIWQFFKNHSR